MSAFRVFGVSRTACKQMAERQVRGAKSMEDFSEQVANISENLYEKGRIRAISPRFCAPQFCYDWIKAGRDTVKSCEIRVLEPVGTKKDGGVKFGWLPYQAEASTQRRAKQRKRNTRSRP